MIAPVAQNLIFRLRPHFYSSSSLIGAPARAPITS
jgi:hypothetical protein